MIVEKPFGHDLASAEALNAQILKVLSEDQIYRIDHFLGKETVQNILVLRFANGIFEPLWNRDHVDHVQITAAETVGRRGPRPLLRTNRRAAGHGAEPSVPAPRHDRDGAADLVRRRCRAREKDRAVPGDPSHFAGATPCAASTAAGVVLGQKVRGLPARARRRAGFRNRNLCGAQARHRQLALGRRAVLSAHRQVLCARTTEIAVHFRQAPYALFRDTPVERLPANILTLRIQPDEGLSVSFSAKRPGSEIEIDGVAHGFCVPRLFRAARSGRLRDADLRLSRGDATLFQRADTVEAAWRALQGLLDSWARHPPDDLPNYAAGSAGPDAADRLLARDGRAWLPISGRAIRTRTIRP